MVSCRGQNRVAILGLPGWRNKRLRQAAELSLCDCPSVDLVASIVPQAGCAYRLGQQARR